MIAALDMNVRIENIKEKWFYLTFIITVLLT